MNDVIFYVVSNDVSSKVKGQQRSGSGGSLEDDLRPLVRESVEAEDEIVQRRGHG